MNTSRVSDGGGSGEDVQHLLVNIISAVYGIISLGFFSNVAVAVVVGNIFIRLGRQLPNRHMLVYVLALCIVDALVLGTLPMLITQLYLQRWIFGQTLCTVFWTIESINKTLSTFILTCLSFDRYLAVRFPQRCLHIRTVRGALYILFSCIVFAALLLMPVYLHAEITHVPVDSGENGTVTSVATCAFVGQSSFLFTIFTLCYLVPLVCMSCFYGSMLARLRHKSRKLGLRQGRVRRVTKKTLTLVVLYFVFWTPYWVMTLRSVVSDAISEAFNKGKDGAPDDVGTKQTQNWSAATSPVTTTVFASTLSEPEIGEKEEAGGDGLSALSFAIMCVVHSGCYLNSAINPILYALLNRELRRQHFAAMNQNGPRSSIPISTNGTGTRPSVANAGHATQRQPLILCSSIDGGNQVRWEEGTSTAPSSGRNFTRKPKDGGRQTKARPFWKLWRRSTSLSTCAENGLPRDAAVVDTRAVNTTLYSRLISLTTVGRRVQTWSTQSNSFITGQSPTML